MAFKFNWPNSNLDQLCSQISDGLEKALNGRGGPSSICDRICVKKIDLGRTAPMLDILEIGDLSQDRFRGIFKFSYSGDASLVLETKVQV